MVLWGQHYADQTLESICRWPGQMVTYWHSRQCLIELLWGGLVSRSNRIAHFRVMWWSWWRRCCDTRQSQQVSSLEAPCHLSHLNTIPLNKYRIDPTQPSSSWPSHILKSLVISGLGTATCKGSVSSLDHQILFWCFRFFTIRGESGDHQGKLVFAHFVTDCLCERAISFFIGQ